MGHRNQLAECYLLARKLGPKANKPRVDKQNSSTHALAESCNDQNSYDYSKRDRSHIHRRTRGQIACV